MKSSWLNLIVLCGLLLTLGGSMGATAQGSSPQAELSTAFTYQGYLAEEGAFANGVYDFRFILYDAEVGGSQAGTIVTQNDLTVIEGLFTVVLDFGPGALNGDARYLEIAVREGSSTGNYTTLSPRQQLAATPYASYAASAPWSGLTNVPSGLNDGDDDSLGELACAGSQVAKWNGTTWICADDDNGITYDAGTGLSLDGSTFNVVTSVIQQRVATACPGGAAIRRINEDGSVVCETDDDTLSELACAGNQIAKWNGTTWACAADDNGTTYTAGLGLSLDGSEFNIVTTTVQRRVATICAAGSAIRQIDASGNVVCEPDDNTTYSPGNQLTLVGTEFRVYEGVGSDLNADLLDGQHGSFYQSATNIDAGTLSNDRFSAHSDLTAEGFLGDLSGDLAQNNGTRQINLNADRLDDQDGSYYQDADHINAGTLNNLRFSAYSDLAAEGYLGNAAGDLAQNNGFLQPTLNADLLDDQEGSYYRNANNINAGTLNTNRFSAYSDLDAEGYLTAGDTGSLARNNGTLQSSLNADLLDGYDADELVSVGAFDGGDQALALDSTDTVVISVTIVAPFAGIIVVTASGTAEFTGGASDVIECSITTGSTVDSTRMVRASDFGAATTEYTPFASTRGYDVASSGSYTYNLVCKASTGSVIVQDTNVTAIFTP
ncbi:MAG: hypothetical protein JXA89_17065 [Anaerolineae bacterium]|nr:hypothetical protein [Anaerolineae bacterium]